MKLPAPPLLLITDRQQARRPLAEVVEAALAAGCRWISVREKDLPIDEQIALAENLRPMIKRAGATLTLHGTIALTASTATLDGIHLPDGADGAHGLPWRRAGKRVGRSIHAPLQGLTIRPDEIDYLIAGPVYASASKPDYGPAIGTEGFAEFARAAPLPVLAIGGIEPENVGAVMRAGAAGVAVMGGVMRARDPGRQIGMLLDALADAISRVPGTA